MNKTLTLAKITFVAMTFLLIGGFDFTSAGAQTNNSCVDTATVGIHCECQGNSSKGCYIGPGSTGCGVCQDKPKGGDGGGGDVPIGEGPLT